MAQGDQTVFSKEIQAFADQVTALENATNDVYNLRGIYTATGATLDNVGDQVGCARPGGMDDNDYLNLILAQIQMNFSGGEPERLISAIRALTNATVINYYEIYPCLIWIEIMATSIPANFWTFMKRLTAGGVALNLIFLNTTKPFYFDSATNGFDNGLLSATINT